MSSFAKFVSSYIATNVPEWLSACIADLTTDIDVNIEMSVSNKPCAAHTSIITHVCILGFTVHIYSYRIYSYIGSAGF